MKKLLLILLFPLLSFAHDEQSRFFIGMMADVNEVRLAKQEVDRIFDGFGINLFRFGRDFRLKNWFSIETSIGVDRIAWSWDSGNEKGKRNVIDPFLSLAFNFHIMDAFVGIGGTYGRPFEMFSEVNGKTPKDGFSVSSSSVTGIWISAGYTIATHYRVALTYYANWMNSDDFPSVWVYGGCIGISFNYMI